MKRMPSSLQAGDYSAALNYLKAVKAAGTDDADKVMAQMKKTKINDMFAKGGYIREDGRMVHDMYLMQVKTPEESKEPWDYYNVVETIPGDAGVRPLKSRDQVRAVEVSVTLRRRRVATMEIFGIPLQALLGQLLLGLVNGSFYAMLSLGLAVIFGLLNIINFAHGALYMMGAYVAWTSLDYLGLNYWVALVLAPLVVGAFGIVIERTMLKQLYKLDHIYGLLLTFGLALIIEGLFRYASAFRASRTRCPKLLQGATNLGFMVLPNYRAWVVLASLVVCFGTWFVIERTRLGAYLRAGTENPKLVQAFGVNVPLMVTLTYGCGAGAGGDRRRARRAGHPDHAADGQQPDHRRVRGRRDRRHGLDPRLDPDRPGCWASSRA